MPLSASDHPLLVPEGWAFYRQRRGEPWPVIHQYWHFLLGYLLPVAQFLDGKQGTFSLLEVGPVMTPIMRRTLQLMGVKTLFRKVTRPTESISLSRWDWQRSDISRVQDAARVVMGAWRGAENCHCSTPTNVKHLLLDRSSAPLYYMTRGPIYRAGYGKTRRNVTNVAELSSELAIRGIAHHVYAPGMHTLGCQISVFRGAERISGIRGAEWANLIWIEKPIKVRVLYPDDGRVSLLPELIKELGHDHEVVVGGPTHGPDSLEQLAAFFSERQ